MSNSQTSRLSGCTMNDDEMHSKYLDTISIVVLLFSHLCVQGRPSRRRMYQSSNSKARYVKRCNFLFSVTIKYTVIVIVSIKYVSD